MRVADLLLVGQRESIVSGPLVADTNRRDF